MDNQKKEVFKPLGGHGNIGHGGGMRSREVPLESLGWAIIQ